jgi:hypothetical protein
VTFLSGVRGGVRVAARGLTAAIDVVTAIGSPGDYPANCVRPKKLA